MLLTLLLTQGTAGGTNYTLTANPGTYSLTGGAASLKVGRNITANAGAYTLTGGSAVLKVGRKITANAGSYALTGGSATLTKSVAGISYTLTANPGTYALSGGAASLKAGRQITALAGAYGVTGGSAQLKTGRVLTALAGSYQVTGGGATLTKIGAVAYTLTALPGDYQLTGGSAELTVTTPNNNRAGFEMGGRRVYIKRGKRIHIFDTVEDADAWVEAEQQATQAIEKAKGKKKLKAKAKVYKALDEQLPHEVIRLDWLESLVAHFNIPVELPTLEAKQDWMEVARIALLAQEMQDEEEVELLLMA